MTVPNEVDGFSHQRVHVGQLGSVFLGRLAAERAETLHGVDTPLEHPPESLRDLLHAFDILRGPIEQIDLQRHRAQDVPEIVGNPRSHLSERPKLLSPLQDLLGSLELGVSTVQSRPLSS